MKVFDYDGGLMKYATLLSRITILNLLWLLCCIPLVTAGASTAAQFYSSSRLMQGDRHVFRNFRQGLKLYWRQGTVVWLFTALLSAAFAIACYILSISSIPSRNVLSVIAGIAFLTLMFITVWIYPVMVNFKGRILEILFNAFVFAFMYAPVTLIAVVFYGIGGFLFVRFLTTRMLVILFGPTFIAYCTLVLFEKVFQKYKLSK